MCWICLKCCWAWTFADEAASSSSPDSADWEEIAEEQSWPKDSMKKLKRGKQEQSRNPPSLIFMVPIDWLIDLNDLGFAKLGSKKRGMVLFIDLCRHNRREASWKLVSSIFQTNNYYWLSSSHTHIHLLPQVTVYKERAK